MDKITIKYNKVPFRSILEIIMNCLHDNVIIVISKHSQDTDKNYWWADSRNFVDLKIIDAISVSIAPTMCKELHTDILHTCIRLQGIRLQGIRRSCLNLKNSKIIIFMVRKNFLFLLAEITGL